MRKKLSQIFLARKNIFLFLLLVSQFIHVLKTLNCPTKINRKVFKVEKCISKEKLKVKKGFYFKIGWKT